MLWRALWLGASAAQSGRTNHSSCLVALCPLQLASCPGKQGNLETKTIQSTMVSHSRRPMAADRKKLWVMPYTVFEPEPIHELQRACCG